MSAQNIDNHQDVLDSRDIIERIEELEGIKANDLPEWDGSDYADELEALQKLAKQGEDYAADWRFGETLIRDSYFEDYARELASDIGAYNEDAGWPNSFIDWERAADALRQDYSSIDFDGVEYWVR